MASNEKTLATLLDLGHSAVRRTRAELIEEAMRLALMLMDADAVSVLPPASARGERLALYAGSASPAVLLPALNGSEVARSLAQKLQPVLFTDLSVDARGAGGDDCPGLEAGPAMFIPLRARGSNPGYLAAYRRRGRARFTLADSRQILLLAGWLNTALDLLRFAGSSERLAMTDDLTEVYNARFLGSALKRELRRAARFSQEMSIVVIDVDHFKAYRQQHGDGRANQLLRQMASLLAQRVRAFDLLGRNGSGDDFVVILPQTGRDAAFLVAERMRQAVEQNAFTGGAAGAVTVSMGVASYPHDGADVAALTNSAKRALERARQQGMNRVEPPIARAA